MAAVFVREIVRLHGCPRSTVSDQDKIFTSVFWEELFQSLGTQLRRNTSYHPQTDGQMEVVNWGWRLIFAASPRLHLNSYNTAFHTSTHLTPFEIVYGRPPPPILSYVADMTVVAEVDGQLQYRDTLLCTLKGCLFTAQQHMTKYANEKW